LPALADGGLRHLGKALQQPRQHHLDLDVVVGDIDLSGRDLSERADAKDHAVAGPALLLDLHHGNGCRSAAKPGLEPAHRFLAAETMRNGNDKRC